MLEKTGSRQDEMDLELAAKCICNLLDGLYPRIMEGHCCPAACDHETPPWQCWVDYFRSESAARQARKEKDQDVAEAA